MSVCSASILNATIFGIHSQFNVCEICYFHVLAENVNMKFKCNIEIFNLRYSDSRSERKSFIDFSLCNTLKIKTHQLNNMYHLEFNCSIPLPRVLDLNMLLYEFSDC